MKNLVAAAVLFVVATGCQTLRPKEDDPGMINAAKGDGDNTARTVGMVAGGVIAAAGPVVMIGGIALDQTPATPPVEAYVAGVGLTAVGVATIIVANAVL